MKKSSSKADKQPDTGDDSNNAVNQRRIVKLSNLSMLTGALTVTLLLAAVANSSPPKPSAQDARSPGKTQENVSRDQESHSSMSITGNEANTSENSDGNTDTEIETDIRSGSSTHIRIETKTQSSVQGQSSTKPSVKLNGEELETDRNGRINETYRDENSRTRIRGRISGDNNTSINISTNESVDIEQESE